MNVAANESNITKSKQTNLSQINTKTPLQMKCKPLALSPSELSCYCRCLINLETSRQAKR